MKIIKVNDSQEKVKYEIYNMQLNQEKARRYREELAKKIQFFKLEFDDNVNNLNHGLEGFYSSADYKKLYEFIEIPKSEKKVLYGEGMVASTPSYHLYPYDENFSLERFKEKFLTQQENFLQQYINEGISNYDFKKVGRVEKIGNAMHAYIFLNSYDNRIKTGYGVCYSCLDNVVCLPNEAIAMYLLEKGYIEEAHYYINKIVDIEKEQKLFANFEFEKSTEFAPEQMQDLLNSGLLKEQTLIRKRELDLYLTNYIK